MFTFPDSETLAEINGALEANTGALGRVARVMAEGMTSPTEMANVGAGANSGHSGNLARVIRCIQEGDVPSAPSRAALAGRSIGGLLRDNPDFSSKALDYLNGLRDLANVVEKDDGAREEETLELQYASDQLTQKVEQLGGVYVYTFPTYLMVPAKVDPERFWFKVGQTGRVVERRIADQLKSTAMPEDPVILRVYTSHSTDPSVPPISYAELEKKFHKLLGAAGHSKTSARSGGIEWFATTTEFLDQIALTLDLVVELRDPDL